MMATSCMLPNSMACCTTCDVRQAANTLCDVIPLTDALRDVISLSTHCHSLIPPPAVTPTSHSAASSPAATSLLAPSSLPFIGSESVAGSSPVGSSPVESSTMGNCEQSDSLSSKGFSTNKVSPGLSPQGVSTTVVLPGSAPQGYQYCANGELSGVLPQGFYSTGTAPRRPSSPLLFGNPTSISSSDSSSVNGVSQVVSATSEGGKLTVLKVPSKFLRYRGEGAEHIVLRVLNSGKVIRLRKTAVGSVSSAADLTLRARKDEEFLCNVARPILGPLLTDESHLVRLESCVIQELNHTLVPEREVHRRHKEINSVGVACICPDAASIFISRTASPLSSSSSISSSLYSDTQCSPKTSSLQDLSTVGMSYPNDVSKKEMKVDNFNQQNGPEFSNGSDQSPLDISIGNQSELNLRINSLIETEENQRTNSQVSPSSSQSLPSNNHFSQTSGCCNLNPMLSPVDDKTHSKLIGDNATDLMPSEPQNICIEIKPKQGFIDTSTPDLPLCRYCVKQHIKVDTEAAQNTSRYCPLDLFSGNLVRMRKAVDGLLESPQNNLKVFVDGESVDNCLSFRYLCDVIIAALTYDFTTCQTTLSEDGYLSPRSPLGRTLYFQTLDRLGVFNAVHLYSHLVQVIGNATAADALLHDLQCWTGDSQFCQSDNEMCTRCIPNDRSQVNDNVVDHGDNQDDSNNAERSHEHSTSFENSILLDDSNDSKRDIVADRKLERSGRASEQETDKGILKIADESKSSIMQEDIIRKLQEYLLSTTAKDLSLMILLSGPHRSTPVPSSPANSSPFIIEIGPGIWYRCQVTGVDLVAKPPSKILKHEKDYMKLKTVLQELEKQGNKPPCCSI